MDGAGKKMPQNGMREERLLTDLKGDFALCDLFSRGSKRVAPILDTRHLKERSTRSITLTTKNKNSFLPPFLVRLQLKLLLFAPGEREERERETLQGSPSGARRSRERLAGDGVPRGLA